MNNNDKIQKINKCCIKTDIKTNIKCVYKKILLLLKIYKCQKYIFEKYYLICLNSINQFRILHINQNIKNVISSNDTLLQEFNINKYELKSELLLEELNLIIKQLKTNNDYVFINDKHKLHNIIYNIISPELCYTQLSTIINMTLFLIKYNVNNSYILTVLQLNKVMFDIYDIIYNIFFTITVNLSEVVDSYNMVCKLFNNLLNQLSNSSNNNGNFLYKTSFSNYVIDNSFIINTSVYKSNNCNYLNIIETEYINKLLDYKLWGFDNYIKNITLSMSIFEKNDNSNSDSDNNGCTSYSYGNHIYQSHVMVNNKICDFYIYNSNLKSCVCIGIKCNDLLLVSNVIIKNHLDIKNLFIYDFIKERYDKMYCNILYGNNQYENLKLKDNIFNTLSLYDLIYLNNEKVESILDNIDNVINKIATKSIIEIINEFLNYEVNEKVDLLSNLLLLKTPNSLFISNILWDVIKDEHTLNNNNLEINIKHNIHPNLLELLELTYNSYQSKDTNELFIDENNLNYERRINLLNLTDVQKQKAYEKLKELNSKSNDNNSKAQQYLDGFLRIPFNKYFQEPIISKSILFVDNITNFTISQLYYALEHITYSYSNIINLFYIINIFNLDSLFNSELITLFSDSYKHINELMCDINEFNISTVISLHDKTNSNDTTNNNNLPDKYTITLELLNNILNLKSNKLYDVLESAKTSTKVSVSSSQSNSYTPRCSIDSGDTHTVKFDQSTIIEKCNNDNLIKTIVYFIYNYKSILEYLKANTFDSNYKRIKKLYSLSNDNFVNKLKTHIKKRVKKILFIQLETLYEINIKHINHIIEFIDSNSNSIIDLSKNNKKYLDSFLTSCINLEINFNTIIRNKQTFLYNCKQTLDKSIYGQHDAKHQIRRIISQWLNGNQDGYVLGFEGSPGIGKTSLAKYGIANALKDENGNTRPFGFIAVGGSSNGSILEGHLYTYVGSTWGRIVDILMNSKCLNPIIFIDELDKISKTENGRELIGILTHLTDKTQNNEFMDKYFSGIKIDLSKVLFIFSYNDYNLLDKILADRIHRIHFENYTIYDKLIIAKDYLIPNVENVINIIDYEIVFPDEELVYLINSYTHEAGVRKLKERLYDIYRDINLRIINHNIYDDYNIYNDDLLFTSKFKITITKDLINDILGEHQKITIVKPFDNSRIGIVYGLYATSSGIGGITIIQLTEQLLESRGILLLTGKQGEVMKESMNVSLTCALSKCSVEALSKYDLQLQQLPELLDNNVSNDSINVCYLDNDNVDVDTNTNTNTNTNDTNDTNDTDNTNNILNNDHMTTTVHNKSISSKRKLSLHIHCPDGATPKDGPSAGCAITIGIISVIEQKPVSNKYSMTGEIDILGNILPIGGLSSKIMGSKNSGIYNVIVPEKNRKDVKKIELKNPGILENINIHFVKHIDDVISLVF
jgi:endopeptidase La